MTQNLSSTQPQSGSQFSRFKADVTTIDSEDWLEHLTNAKPKATSNEDKQLVQELRDGCEKAKSERVTILTRHYDRVIALAGVKPPKQEGGK